MTTDATGTSTPPAPQVSIVIPIFNEAHRLPTSLPRLAAFVRGLDIPAEVILVVEPSKDQSLAIAQVAVSRNPGWRLIAPKKHRGKGAAVRNGIAEATGDIIFYFDADLSTSLDEIPRFLETFKNNPQLSILVGDRTLPASHIDPPQTDMRIFLGQTFRIFTRTLFRLPVFDTQCGFKAMRNSTARTLVPLLTNNRFAFDIELLLLAREHGHQFQALPINWANSPKSTLRWPRDASKLLFDILRLRRHHTPPPQTKTNNGNSTKTPPPATPPAAS